MMETSLQVLSLSVLDRTQKLGDQELLCSTTSYWRHNFSRNGADFENIAFPRFVKEG
jgi:hypothetical protein